MDRHQGYEIHVNAEPIHDIAQYLKMAGYLRRCKIVPLGGPKNFREEELGLGKQDIREASLVFERTRNHVRTALQAIMGWVFKKYNLPTRNGVDVGSGATGEMVEQLLSPLIVKPEWQQIEINPSAVAENRRRHPGSRIVQGSYLRLGETAGIEDGSLDIVSGLSSLDATQFVNQAIEEIRRVLKIGGYFLHVQDVRPGIGAGLREMQAMGAKTPYEIESLVGGDEVPFIYHSPEGPLSVVELFRRNIGRSLKKNGQMSTLANNLVTTRRYNRQLGSVYHSNIFMQVSSPKVEEVSAVVTLARRVA